MNRDKDQLPLSLVWICSDRHHPEGSRSAVEYFAFRRAYISLNEKQTEKLLSVQYR
jgi:hypothetical protein